MPKKVVIKENTIEAPEETREEILEHVEQAEVQPQPPAEPPPLERQPTQKAEGRTRMRELYRCEYCNKYLTKKSLNYSHTKYCRGQQPEQVEDPPPPEPEETIQEPPQTRRSMMEQFRPEQRQLKQERIRLLAQNIA